MRFILDEGKNEISFRFDTRAYHREALYGASLVFTDRAFVYLEKQGKERLIVTLQGKSPLPKERLNALAGEFHNELLNQTLRWMVAKHNRKTKEAIQAQALFSAHTPAKPRRLYAHR